MNPIRSGAVESFAGPGGLPTYRLHGPGGAHVDVSAQGGQVLGWVDAGGHERLFLSPAATLAGGGAIRGGVPIVFPQFSSRGVLVKHGFARHSVWRFEAAGCEEGAAHVRLVLSSCERTLALWPHRFVAGLAVRLDRGSLRIELSVRNEDDSPLAFTAALHTYLAVSNLAGTRLEGLEGRPYEDAADGGTWKVQDGAPVRFGAELDRVYPDVAGELALRSGADLVRVRTAGFRDVVVWNPGQELAARLPDLGAGQQERFVCVEAAAVLAPIVLAPRERWVGSQTLLTGASQGS